MITPIVIQTKRPDGLTVTYLKKPDNFYKKSIKELQHKCRIKEVIYGGVYGYYADGMDFTLALTKGGGVITIDKREEFGFEVLGS